MSRTPPQPIAPMLTREQILAAYQAGPEAIVALIEPLQQALVLFSARMQELERRLGQDSHNSHRPPSSDSPYRKQSRDNSLRAKPGTSGKKSGGQPGHPGQTLIQVAEPDAIQRHLPADCAHCGHSLDGIAATATERRQVFDLPPMRLLVTEHQAESRCCPHCHSTTQAAFPEAVKQPVQYGPDILALSVYLRTVQLLPSRRTCDLLGDLFGQAPSGATCSGPTPSEGTVAHAVAVAAERVAPIEAQIRAAIHQSAVVHLDETGLRSEGRLRWLHTASTSRLTFYRMHPKRGCEALNEIGILPGLTGTCVHDAYASYLTYPAKHALCNAHLLRDLIALKEETAPSQSEPGQPSWVQQLIDLLLEMKRETDTARAAALPAVAAESLSQFRQRYDALLAAGRAAHPPTAPVPGKRGRRKRTPAENLLARLSEHASAVLAFLYDLRVPFDNNLAERDLRMMKVQQKISGGFRSALGAPLFCTLRGYASTLRKQQIPLFSAFRSIFSATPLIPQLQG